MPYPNEHAARVAQPGQFDRFARKTVAPGVSIVLGKKGSGPMTAQAYRFDSAKFTADQAKKWLKDNNVKPLSFEEASEEKGGPGSGNFAHEGRPGEVGGSGGEGGGGGGKHEAARAGDQASRGHRGEFGGYAGGGKGTASQRGQNIRRDAQPTVRAIHADLIDKLGNEVKIERVAYHSDNAQGEHKFSVNLSGTKGLTKGEIEDTVLESFQRRIPASSAFVHTMSTQGNTANIDVRVVLREHKEMSMDEPEQVEAPGFEQKMYDDAVSIVNIIPASATTFAEVEEYFKSSEISQRVQELTRQFQTISSNIMFSPDVTDKPGALRLLVNELDAKLVEAVGTAGDGFFGKAKAKVLKALGVSSKLVPVDESKPRFMIWKEGGQYRWLAVYSNKYRDEDNPPEILSAKAHQEFVAEVDAGRAPYPELWHYHVPGTRWGQSDFVAFDEGSGFSLASGTVDKGHEPEAEVMAELDHPLAVSHGLEVLERDSKDSTIIEKYRTVEISDLPLVAAANKLTGFSILKGAMSMTLSADKKAHLQKVGLKPEAIAALEADLDAKAKAAETAGIESKEVTPVVERKDETVVAPQPVAPPTPVYATAEEVAAAITPLAATIETLKPLVGMVQALTEAMTKMAKTDEERIVEKAAATPGLSIAALVMKNLSAIGKEASKVGIEDMKLAKDKPAEVAAPSRTGIPFLDTMLAGEAKPQ